MQTPQCFIGPLESSSLASLTKLRSTLQEIPRKWLARNEAPSDDHLFGHVTGECNYNFTLRVEGGGFFQTGMLVASAERESGSLPVPLKCRWMRRVGDVSLDIPGVTTNMYQVSADDVGTHICVEASPADIDDGLYGAVVGEIGPFELDPATRRSLDNALGLGSSRFIVNTPPKSLDEAPTAANRQDSVIYVSQDGVRIVPIERGSERHNKEVVAEYTADYPKVIIHPLDNTKFHLHMSNSQSFALAAPSRANRDLIALTIRCFHATKYVSTNSVLAGLMPPPPSDAQGSPTDARLDACIRLERLLKELNESMQKKEMSEKVLRNTKYEKKQLQEQLMESISGCTDVIVGLQEQFADGGMGAAPMVSVERLQEQLREAKAQETAAREELQATKQRGEDLRTRAKALEEAKIATQQFRAERDMLQGRIIDLTTSSASAQQQDQADQVHTAELKRHRQDVEALHNRKEQLIRDLREKETEKQELQENFFYVKSQLDRCQLRIAQDADGEGAVKELERHNQTLGNARDEKMRFSIKIENVLRDQEKEKVYHEQQLERVTTANARLMEERDRAAREVQRVSQMYSEAVAQLQKPSSQMGQSDLFATEPAESGASAPADPEEVSRVRAEMAQTEEALQKKAEENESLRTRIRKLAVE